MRYKITCNKEDYKKIMEMCWASDDKHRIMCVDKVEPNLDVMFETFEKDLFKIEIGKISKDLVIEVYRLKYDCDKMRCTLTVDPSWLNNITNQDIDQICWEEKLNPYEDGYTSTFGIDYIRSIIEEEELLFDEQAMKEFEEEIKRVGNVENATGIRCILDIQ